MMTKEDYEVIAGGIGFGLAKGDVIEVLCNFLKQRNPNFNKDKFINHIMKIYNISIMYNVKNYPTTTKR